MSICCVSCGAFRTSSFTAITAAARCSERDARSLSATRVALNAPELRGAIFVNEIHSSIETRWSASAFGDEKVIRVDRLQSFRDRRRVVCEDSRIRVRPKEIAEE